MKTRLFLLAAALLAAFVCTGCKKENEALAVDNTSKIVGEWHCAPEQYDVDVYVAFYADGAFDEYQRIGEGRFRHYAGSWSVDKSTLSGIYADGTEWASTYTLSFEDNTMTLTANNDSAEAIVYTKTSIPAKVKDEAIEPLGPETLTRSEESRWF